MDKERAAFLLHEVRGLGREVRVVVGDSDVEGLARRHDVAQGAERLLEWGLGVRAVVVEDVHVVEAQAAQRGVEGAHEVLARTACAVGRGVHLEARLGRNNHLVTVALEVPSEVASEVLFGGAGTRTVVIRKVEVRDAVVEGRAKDGGLGVEGGVVAEVVPQA